MIWDTAKSPKLTETKLGGRDLPGALSKASSCFREFELRSAGSPCCAKRRAAQKAERERGRQGGREKERERGRDMAEVAFFLQINKGESFIMRFI